MADAMVRVERCAKRYGAVQALATTDLEVGAGEFVTLLGPSGSGKTTILNLIAGTVMPTSGRIHIAGQDVTNTPVEKRGLGMVFQNYALMPHMTVFENVAFPLRVRHMPETEIRRKVGEVLELVRLPDLSGRKPRQLSGGQQQRVALARCIVYNPPSDSDGRAARRSRQEAARADAARDSSPARCPRRDNDLCDARSGGGIDDVRPHRPPESTATSSRPARRTKSTSGLATYSLRASSGIRACSM